MCLSHLIYTVRPCLIHTCYAAPMPCSDHAVLLKTTAKHGRLKTAVLCLGLEKNGMVRAWHGRGVASVNQTRPHCVNQMGKTHSKPLAARHGRGTAWARHGHGMLCVNRPLWSRKLRCCRHSSWSLNPALGKVIQTTTLHSTSFTFIALQYYPLLHARIFEVFSSLQDFRLECHTHSPSPSLITN